MNYQIDRDAYLDYAKKLTKSERKIISVFEDWLPEHIIDCHAHCNLSQHVRDIDHRTFNHMLSTFPSFSLEESQECQTLFHPSKKIRSLRFPKTFRGIDHKSANLYLLNNSPEQDRVALYGLPDDIEYTIGMLDHPRVSALKMYYSYLEPPATEIYQYFPKEVLEVAQNLDVPLVLHPPRKITACINQILQLLKDFPRLRFCLAHLSLTKSVVPGLQETFDLLAKYDRVYFDTALVPSEDVVSVALRSIGEKRIMYGTDEPLHLIRSVPYKHPIHGERIVSEYKYHWINKDDHDSFKYLAKNATHAHWQALLALKNGISQFTNSEQNTMRNNIFHDNAKEFYAFSP